MQNFSVLFYFLIIALVVLVPTVAVLRWVVLPALKEPRFSLRATLFDIIGLVSLPFSGSMVVFAMAPDNGGSGSGLAWIAILTVTSAGLFGLAVIVSLGFSIRFVLRIPKLVRGG